ncbi:MAG: poly(ADP-ribose) glycohydrolase domain-containing protein, partial [Alphaproteobacteria bacterium]
MTKYLYTCLMLVLLVTPSFAKRERSAMGELRRLNHLTEQYLKEGKVDEAKQAAAEASSLTVNAYVPASLNGEEYQYKFGKTKATKEQAQQMTKALSFAVNLGKQIDKAKAVTPHSRAVDAIIELANSINNQQGADTYSDLKVGSAMRKSVFNVNQEILEKNRYITGDGMIYGSKDTLGTLFSLPNVLKSDDCYPLQSLEKTIFDQKGLPDGGKPLVRYDTEFAVWNSDVLDAYLILDEDDRNKTAIVDFANAIWVGGGAKVGASAQEEQICYCTSDLYSNLMQHPAKPHKNGRDKFEVSLDRDINKLLAAPKETESESGLYIPEITIIRSNGISNKTKNNLFPEELKDKQRPFPYTLHEPIKGPAVIVSAAYIVKKSSDGKLEVTSDRTNVYNVTQAQYDKLNKHKLRYQLRSALKHKKTILIAGAFGCGAFNNDPIIMARLYREVLNEPEFFGAFEKVIFANLIVETKGVANFIEFKKVFDPKPAEDNAYFKQLRQAFP